MTVLATDERPASPPTASAGDARAQSWAWVRAVQAGDRAAFGTLYRRYEPDVRRFVRTQLRPADRAPGLVEDLTSETFVNALDAIDRVSDQGYELFTWLRRIARNLVRGHYAKACVQRDVALDERIAADTTSGELGSPERLVLDAIDREALHEAITEALREGELTPLMRRCVELYDLLERTPDEVAQIMGSTREACQRQRHDAWLHLADTLAETFNLGHDPDDSGNVSGSSRYRRVLEGARTAHARRHRTHPTGGDAEPRTARPTDQADQGETFAVELRARRRAAGLTQRTLARALGCSQPSVCAAESGGRLPDRGIAERADEYLEAAGVLLAAWETTSLTHARRRREQDWRHLVTHQAANQDIGPDVAGEGMLSIDQAAAQLGISRTRMKELLRCGAVFSVRIGRYRRIPTHALTTYQNTPPASGARTGEVA